MGWLGAPRCRRTYSVLAAALRRALRWSPVELPGARRRRLPCPPEASGSCCIRASGRSCAACSHALAGAAHESKGGKTRHLST